MKKFIVAVLVLCIPVWASAATDAEFSWAQYDGEAIGFKMVMDSGTNVVQTIPDVTATSTVFSIVDDTICHSFALLAYSADEESLLSEFAVLCPPKPKKPKKIESFFFNIL